MAYNKKKHLLANIEAIQTAFSLEKEKRKATPAERRVLEEFSGFGGIKAILNPIDNLSLWNKTDSELFPLKCLEKRKRT